MITIELEPIRKVTETYKAPWVGSSTSNNSNYYASYPAYDVPLAGDKSLWAQAYRLNEEVIKNNKECSFEINKEYPDSSGVLYKITGIRTHYTSFERELVLKETDRPMILSLKGLGSNKFYNATNNFLKNA